MLAYHQAFIRLSPKGVPLAFIAFTPNTNHTGIQVNCTPDPRFPHLHFQVSLTH